jgi:NedA-like, galactose-binding domain
MIVRWGTITKSFLCICAIFGGVKYTFAGPLTSNLALAGTATATGADFGSSIGDAIDGNRDGNFGNGSVFYGNANPPTPLFYEADLGSNNYIERVQILRRTDADQGVFGNMRLTIYQDDGAGGHGPVAFTQDYLTSAFTIGSWGTTAPGASAPGGAFGRHVRLERIDNNYWLTFAEFEVIGRSSPLTFTETNNLAFGKPVTTLSPPGYGALITSGNDGNINADFNHPDRSVYHSTNYGVGEYWQVDLGAETPLDFVELYARSDGGTTSQFKVSILNSLLAEVGSVTVDNAPPNTVVPDYDHTIDLGGMTGRYIRVATTREEYLSFTELRAFAAVPEPSSITLVWLGLLAFRRPFIRRR